MLSYWGETSEASITVNFAHFWDLISFVISPG